MATSTITNFRAIHEQASAEGHAAAMGCVPQPMIVSGGGRQYYVEDGLCGFASVRFAGNTAWGRWAKAQGIADKAYGGGLKIWVSDYGQSVARKGAYADAYARVLGEHGITAYAESHLD